MIAHKITSHKKGENFMLQYKKLVVCTMLITAHLCGNNVNYISFDIGMKVHLYPNVYEATTRVIGLNGIVLYNFFKNLYEKNISIDYHERIPKIIHQIWLDGKNGGTPTALQPLQQSWIQHHLDRGWKYKLWTDADIEQFNLYNKQFYDASDNFGVKADILRWEIIYRYGGFYLDMDHECLNPLEPLLKFDFVTCLQPLDAFFVQLGAAFFGSRPGHPILKHCIETIKDDWNQKGAPKKTGPVHFTKSFYAVADKDNNYDIALPAFYFYPLGSQDTVINKQAWINDGAFAVHWWAKTWMPKEYRPEFSKNIHNDASAISWND